MISVELAERLRSLGVPWTPSPGDRFVVRDRGMDDEVFVIAEMVVEAAAQPSGHVLRFNGTTEWALDSLDQDAVLWLPRETQLRELLADAFVGLSRRDDRYVVAWRRGADERVIEHADAECAYALAVLAVGE
ncbi:MAG: pilus assembly protein CpaE [Angustibacter sp.]